jgi:hypothetical protein
LKLLEDWKATIKPCTMRRAAIKIFILFSPYGYLRSWLSASAFWH